MPTQIPGHSVTSRTRSRRPLMMIF
jgi:hypothetical protein